jgi:hypothetical protein
VIRLTLRQFRTEAVIGFGLLAALAIVLVVTGVHLAHLNDAFQSSCKVAGDCATASNPVIFSDAALQGLLPIVVIIAPGLIGVFFGAPLIARELETGTFRLAWTQSVTRQRWLVVKLGIVGIAAMALGGLLTWMVDWWATPLDAGTNAASQNRFELGNFAFHGVAPIGYAAFAFALGATAGVLLRRTVPAMGVTIVGFILARLAVTYWVRPHLASPVAKSLPLSASGGFGFNQQEPSGTISLNPPQVSIPNAWVYSTSVVNKAGQAPTTKYLLHACPMLDQVPPGAGSGGQSVVGLAGPNGGAHAAPGPPGMQACIDKLSASYHTVITYQPGSRFWPFQWAEMGIFLAGALALCTLMFVWSRRRYA